MSKLPCILEQDTLLLNPHPDYWKNYARTIVLYGGFIKPDPEWSKAASGDGSDNDDT